MQTPFIKIMRRSLIGVILLVLLAVLLNYLQTWRNRNGSVKETPQILSSEMVRSVEKLEYSDYQEGVLHFKINARKLLESGAGKSYLEAIEANDFNPDGSIRNEIQSKNAVYDQRQKVVDFSGDVRLFLGSDIELRTNSLHYDLNTNTANTKDALQFYAPAASGTARGVHYDQKQGYLDLGSEVDFVLTRKNALSGKDGEPENLHATSEKAHFSEMESRILFEGKASLQSDSGALAGDRIEIALSPGQRRVTSITASGDADYRFNDAGEMQNLRGDQMVFNVNASGALDRIMVSNQAVFSSTSSSGELDLQGGEIILEFDSAEGSLRQLRSRTGVLFQIKNGLNQTLISGGQLQADFNPETKNVQSLHVSERAGFSVSGSGDSRGNELQADEIRMNFLERDGHAVMEKLRADGSARWDSAPQVEDSASALGAGWTLTASLLEFLYSDEGDFLESSTATGNVLISQNSNESSALAQVRRLNADYAKFGFFPETNQPRDMEASGHVRVTYEQKSGAGADSSVESFRTASERMHAVFELRDGLPELKSVLQSGKFTYQDAQRSASADTCNYDSEKELLVLEGAPQILDSLGVTTGKRVEYDQKQKELLVFGHVRSILGTPKDKGSFLGSSSSSSPIIVTAEEMRYRTEDGQARYTTNVQLLTESQQLQAQTLGIFGGGDRVDAQGGVLHLISGSGISKDPPEADKSKKSLNSEKQPIIIRSSKLTYSREDKALDYYGNIRLNSGDLDLYSSSLNAILDSEEKSIESAIAQGAADGREKLFIRQGVRECEGNVAYWYLDPGKFVVIGDPAEAYDPERGRSSAPRLTYFTADDRIRLESE